MARERANAEWKINIQEACEKRGIKNPYQLWQKLGGSKETTAKLWSGNSVMITTSIMNKLHDRVGITPFEYMKNG